jgi:hypothetical protein
MVELRASHVLEDPTFSTPTERYMVSFVAFYECGFNMPSHRFICSFL